MDGLGQIIRQQFVLIFIMQPHLSRVLLIYPGVLFSIYPVRCCVSGAHAAHPLTPRMIAIYLFPSYAFPFKDGGEDLGITFLCGPASTFHGIFTGGF